MYFRPMVLVTGGTGLVGTHLLYQLVLQGEHVIAIHRKMSNLERVKQIFSFYSKDSESLFEKIKWVEADILDIPSLTIAFKGVTHVYHSAALISFDASDYKKMRKINIEGTANIVNLCISNAISKLCFVSSIASIGKPVIGNQINETNSWNKEDTNNGYAITKYGAEMEVWRASQEGIPVIIVNPGIILGSGYWNRGSGELFSKLFRGFPFYTEGETGFVGVQDVVQIMIQLMKSTLVNERYILRSENASYKTVFFAIADGFNKKRPSIKLTKFMSQIGWRIFALLSFLTRQKNLFTKQAAKSSQNKYRYSNAKIKEALHYKFEPLEKTIKNICTLYKKQEKIDN